MTETKITHSFKDLIALSNKFPIGLPLSVEHDGFQGIVIGYYITLEGKPGLVLQLNWAKVVHVYSTKWFENLNNE